MLVAFAPASGSKNKLPSRFICRRISCGERNVAQDGSAPDRHRKLPRRIHLNHHLSVVGIHQVKIGCTETGPIINSLHLGGVFVESYDQSVPQTIFIIVCPPKAKVSIAEAGAVRSSSIVRPIIKLSRKCGWASCCQLVHRQISVLPAGCRR